MASFRIIPGKDIGNDPNDIKDTTDLNFTIQDNGGIPGAGMPVTIALCRKIVHDFDKRQSAIFKKLNELPTTPELDALKEGISASAQIVSGVYGRETILHLLEQEGCEGIMYINGIYGGKDTIVLIGVDKSGTPIGGNEQFSTDNRPAIDAVIYEIKGGGKTRGQILEMMPVG